MNNKSIILSQGLKPIIISLLIALFFKFVELDALGNIAIVISLFIVFMYRNPTRYIFENTKHILSPVDGKITAVDSFEDKTRIYCKVGLLDSHNIKAPVSGELKIKKVQKGLHLNPNSLMANSLNEQVVIKIGNVKLKLLSGFCNGSIDITSSQKLEQGDNISVLTDGYVVMTLKHNEEINIKIGDKLVAGQTVIATK